MQDPIGWRAAPAQCGIITVLRCGVHFMTRPNNRTVTSYGLILRRRTRRRCWLDDGHDDDSVGVSVRLRVCKLPDDNRDDDSVGVSVCLRVCKLLDDNRDGVRAAT